MSVVVGCIVCGKFGCAAHTTGSLGEYRTANLPTRHDRHLSDMTPRPTTAETLAEMRDEHVMENDLRRRDVLRWAAELEAVTLERDALREALGLLITHAIDSLGVECDVIRTARAAVGATGAPRGK